MPKQFDFNQPRNDNMNGVEATHLADQERDAQRISTTVLRLETIYPDITQPRKMLPADVAAWLGELNGIPNREWFEAWHGVAFANEVDPPSAYTLLSGTELDGELTGHAQVFAELAALAHNIRDVAKKLLVPIQVMAVDSDEYMIVFGERRWLAFHMLAAYYQDERRWQHIPAQVISATEMQAAVIAQAVENTGRKNLSGVEMARQLAKLLMYFHEREAGRALFVPATQFDHEREFYAQVADGNQFPLSKAWADELLSTMGFSTKREVTRYRAVLALSNDAWDQAAREGWTATRIMKEEKRPAKTHGATDADDTTVSSETMTMAEQLVVKMLGKRGAKELARRILGIDEK